MATTIKLKNSVTTTNAPSSLVQGEVAINITDKKVWVGNAAGTPIQLLGAGGSASFGALTCTSLTNSGLTSGRVTYASTGGLLADSANFTFNGTTVTMANDASISGLTVGKGGGAVSTNTVLGLAGGNGNTTGNQNTFVGYASGYVNTTGSNNIGLGYAAFGNGSVGVTGNNNIGIGVFAANLMTSGGSNTAVGNSALYSNTTASNNTAVGYQAGYSNNGANSVDAFGFQALYGNTSGAVNGAFAAQALFSNTTGSSNYAFGYYALGSNTSGNANSAFGREALRSNTTASNNTAVGYQAGYTSATSNEQTFIGYQAGKLITGAQNTMIGSQSGVSATSGVNNTFVGYGSGGSVTTGGKNTILGSYSGNQGSLDIRTLSNRIVISDGDGNPRIYVNDGGEVIVGGVTDQGAYNLQCNGTGVWGAGAYVNGSDARIKENITPLDSGLDVIAKLNPVTYKYKETWSKDQSIQTGFIAQELLTALEGKNYADGVVQQGGSQGYYSVAYQNIIPILTKAIQELKAEVDSLKAQFNK